MLSRRVAFSLRTQVRYCSVEIGHLVARAVAQRVPPLVRPEMLTREPKEFAELGKTTDVEDVKQLVEMFGGVKRRVGSLQRALKRGIYWNMDSWTAGDFAVIVHGWKMTNFLTEDFLLMITPRILETYKSLTPEGAITLLDGFAYLRFRSAAIQPLTEIIEQHIATLPNHRYAAIASAYARLDMAPSKIFLTMALRLAQDTPEKCDLSAYDLSILSFGLVKTGYADKDIFRLFSQRGRMIATEFTGAQMALTLMAFARFGARDLRFFEDMSYNMHWRMAQLTASDLARTFRSFAILEHSDAKVQVRALVELPRVLEHAHPADVATLFAAFTQMQVRSPFLNAMVLSYCEKHAPFFSARDRASIKDSLEKQGGVSQKAQDVFVLYSPARAVMSQ